MTTINIATAELLGALDDTVPFSAARSIGPERGLLLHTRDSGEGLLLGVTAAADPDAHVCATATIIADGDDWGPHRGFVLTSTHVRMIRAYTGAAHRPESRPMHEVSLTLSSDGRLRIVEAGTFDQGEWIAPSGNQDLEPHFEPSEWPQDAVNTSLGGQLDPGMTPCALAVDPAWMRRVAAVSARRGQPYRMHSGSDIRCLVSVGRDWTASLPAFPQLPTRVTAGDFWNLTTTSSTKAA